MGLDNWPLARRAIGRNIISELVEGHQLRGIGDKNVERGGRDGDALRPIEVALTKFLRKLGVGEAVGDGQKTLDVCD